MLMEDASVSTKFVKPLDTKESPFSKDLEQCWSTMTLTEHESVPVGVVRPVWIDVEDSPVQIDK